MQLLRTKGCSEQEGDGEAHQGQPCQTGGSENRKGLDHRQLQHSQNLKQFLRLATIPVWSRCNPSRQRRQASDSWAALARLSPIQKPLRLVQQSSFHEAVSWPSSAMAIDRQRLRGPHQRRLEADAAGFLQFRLMVAAIPLLRSPQCTTAKESDAISCLVRPTADQRLKSALLLWCSGLRNPTSARAETSPNQGPWERWLGVHRAGYLTAWSPAGERAKLTSTAIPAARANLALLGRCGLG